MKTLFLIIGLLISSNMLAQYKTEEFEPSLVQTKFGALIVFNGQKNSFTLRINSKSIEPTEQESFLLVDKKLMQSSVIPFQEKYDFNSLSVVQQRDLLTGYKQYERDYIQEQLKTTLTESEKFVNLEGKIFKYWAFDMPKDNNSVAKQVYLFTICFDQILILNGPVLKDQNVEEMETLLINVAKTLELFPDKTQDIRKLYFDLNN